MADVVTGEAVPLELRLAKWPGRSLAVAIDLAVQIVLLVVVSIVIAGTALSVDSALGAAITTVVLLAIIVGIPVASETLSRGRTLGKLVVGLRVVREDGGPIRFRHAFVRGLLGLVEIWLTVGVVATLVSLVSTQGRRVGDFLAGTLVLRERVPSPAAPMAVMPPSLTGWATTLDLSAVPEDLALAARQYLSRMPELAPQVRDRMGQSLAAAVAATTSPPPPAGVPAWAFLSAVVAERRRRESMRLSGPGSTGANQANQANRANRATWPTAGASTPILADAVAPPEPATSPSAAAPHPPEHGSTAPTDPFAPPG